MRPIAHLLVGFIGSGKTTFARALERKTLATRYSFDEWMVRLYGPSPPEAQYPDLFIEVEELIWEEAEAKLGSGQDVIIDHGFWTRNSRDTARKRVIDNGAIPRFYNVVCPRDVMKSRALERSKDPPKDSMWIDDPAFEKLILRFEPMSSDEEFMLINGGA